MNNAINLLHEILLFSLVYTAHSKVGAVIFDARLGCVSWLVLGLCLIVLGIVSVTVAFAISLKKRRKRVGNKTPGSNQYDESQASQDTIELYTSDTFVVEQELIYADGFIIQTIENQ